MSELLDYLNYYNSSKLFEPGEFTTPTRFTYTAITSAVHDGADILLIKLNRFEWYSDGKFIDSYLSEDMTVPEPSYNVILHKILERDFVLRNHMIIDVETSNETVVRIQE